MVFTSINRCNQLFKGVINQIHYRLKTNLTARKQE